MDNNKNDQSTAPVMDIQPSVGGVPPPTPGSMTAAPSAEDTIAPESLSAPAASSFTGPTAPAPAPAGMDNSAVPPSSENPMAAPQIGKPKKKRTGMVIIVATIVALALAAAAYYAYMKNMDNEKTASKPQTTTTAPAVVAAKSTDVDQTTQDIDKDLASANDATDFAAADLSDATLGL
jgi:hypothetical protein